MTWPPASSGKDWTVHHSIWAQARLFLADTLWWPIITNHDQSWQGSTAWPFLPDAILLYGWFLFGSCTPRRWWLRAAPRCWARLPGSTHHPGRSWWRAPCRGLSGQLGTRQTVLLEWWVSWDLSFNYKDSFSLQFPSLFGYICICFFHPLETFFPKLILTVKIRRGIEKLWSWELKRKLSSPVRIQLLKPPSPFSK